MKQCKRCLEFKPLLEFYSHRDTADKKTPNCKTCHNLLRKESRIKRLMYWRSYDKARDAVRNRDARRMEQKAEYLRIRRLRKRRRQGRME